MASFLQIIAAYSLWLICFGTIGNLLSVFICFRLRKNSTFVFLGFKALSDIFTTYNWNLNIFAYVYFQSNLTEASLFACRFFYWFEFTSLQSSVWLLVRTPNNHDFKKTSIFLIGKFCLKKVLMSIDRSLTIITVKWKIIFKSKHAVWACVACITVLMLVNSNVFILYGGEKVVNGTVVTICAPDGTGLTSWLNTWNKVRNFPLSQLTLENAIKNLFFPQVHAVLYSYLPAFTLLLTNARLIFKFNSTSNTTIQNEHTRKRNSSVNRTVVFSTILFLVMTLPGAITTTITSDLDQQNYFTLILVLISFSSSYHAYDALFLYFTNPRFAEQLKSILFWRNIRNQPKSSVKH